MPNSYPHFLEIELNDQVLKQQEDALQGKEPQQTDDFFRDLDINSEDFVQQQGDKESQQADVFFLDFEFDDESLEQQETGKEPQQMEDIFLDFELNAAKLEPLKEPEERDPEVNLKKRKMGCIKKEEDNNESTKKSIPSYWLPKEHKKRMRLNMFELNEKKSSSPESIKHKKHMKKFMSTFDINVTNEETNNVESPKKTIQPAGDVTKYCPKKRAPHHSYMFYFENKPVGEERTEFPQEGLAQSSLVNKP
ncbi:hypothetical protein [Legionella cherrii]|uniref:Uncharacterized protein n=1 Tax=Legionella cherrii TaxID=28084 RepID=A0ABY6T9Q8_9GAMM|nr:hypothetical protein [Legionella cherrii]VEB38311.1 Uncharacterised protein [Legionella cherrii]